MSPSDRRAAVADALCAVGAAHLAKRRPSRLSHGEIQRVGIAVAIGHRPRLIVADEPTGQLDVGNADAMLDLLAAIAHETGATLVIATHDDAGRASPTGSSRSPTVGSVTNVAAATPDRVPLSTNTAGCESRSTPANAPESVAGQPSPNSRSGW